MIKDANKAVSDVAYKFSELCAIYPITPSSPMASNVDNLSSKNEKNIFDDTVEVVQMQSEAGVAGVLHGALISGTLASTFTSSQGLLLMIPNMYKIAGECLPGVIHVAARSLSTHALSIFGDHQDIYATRATGFCMLASSSVEDSQYMAAISHLSAIKASLPFLHFFDGFRTSHEINTINDFPYEKICNLVDKDKVKEFKESALNISNNVQKGLALNEDIYFQTTEARNSLYLEVPNIVNDYMQKINKIAKTSYKPFNYYGDEHAKDVIVAMGSVCDTARLVVDDLNSKGKKVGLIEVHLYRPFSQDYLKKVLPSSTKRIAVLDRTKEAGAIYEPLCLDVIAALKDTNIHVVGGRYGLSSKDVTPAHIKSVYDMLETDLKEHFVIGIEDDITNLSLPISDYKINLNATEMLVYGYGSDGMVSTCKEMLNIVNQEKSKFVQGYFEYDSKKSGGVTKSHIRISDEVIKAPYYVTNPKCIIISKPEYIFEFNLLDDILDNGLVLLNIDDSTDLEEYLPNEFKKIIVEKKLRLLTVDAKRIALKYNLGNKISKIMEIVILELLGVNNAVKILCKSIENNFKTKGKDVVNNNISAIKETLDNVKIYNSLSYIETEHFTKKSGIFDLISRREGNKLKVSDLYDYKNGTFPCNINTTTRQISDIKPKWIKENCIECGLCSFVCPHGVIRPFITEDKGIALLGSKDEKKKYLIEVNGPKCTGCGLCIEACPGKAGNKALEFIKNSDNEDYVNKLFENYENEAPANKFTVKNSQLIKPKFAYSGACAGCGETSYIKLLTQLVGDNLVIANATGCSSIYGGSLPHLPYSIPWASSLFEDNAEFGYGIYLSYKKQRQHLKNKINETINLVDKDIKELFTELLDNYEDFDITLKIKKQLENKNIPNDIRELINYIPSRQLWCIGGDGWAYDIGFSGIDHILSTSENVKILVLDTEVYSNTGGQSSKSSQLGQVAEFASSGKKTTKKDLFKIAMSYPNAYVASVSLGANPNQCIKAFKEAINHDGPAIIIAYSPCVEQGIKSGMKCSLEEQKKLVECGYLLLMRYDSTYLSIDSKEPNFDKYIDVLNNEVRYNSLMIKNESQAKSLLENSKKSAIDRYNYYKKISQK